MTLWQDKRTRLSVEIANDYVERDALRGFHDSALVTLADGQRMPAAAARRLLSKRIDHNEYELELMDSVRTVDWPMELG